MNNYGDGVVEVLEQRGNLRHVRMFVIIYIFRAMNTKKTSAVFRISEFGLDEKRNAVEL